MLYIVYTMQVCVNYYHTFATWKVAAITGLHSAHYLYSSMKSTQNSILQAAKVW